MTEIAFAADGAVTRKNFEKAGYARMFRGVYARIGVDPGADEWEIRRHRLVTLARAAITAFSDKDPILYGPTALEILGVALPQRWQDWNRCHIAIRNGAWRPRHEPIVVHEMVRMVDVWRRPSGLPVMNPVDHMLQLRGATLDELVEVGDGLMRRQRPLLTMVAVQRRVEELAGATGVKAVRRALRWMVPETDSLPETSTRMLLVHAGLPQPVVNLPVFCQKSGRTYHVDLGYEDERVAVEYDGAVHGETYRQIEIDARRRRELQDESWTIITVTSDSLKQPEAWIRSVEDALLLRRSRARDSW